MKRYCIDSDITPNDFLAQDKGEYYDINFRQLIYSLIICDTQENITEEVAGDSYWLLDFLDDISISEECEYDILNEIYLSILYAENKKESLFGQRKSNINILEDGSYEVEKSMKETINNRKKVNASNNDLIFDITSLKSVSKKTKIKAFGTGVIKLWLYSADFKSLFSPADTQFNKYRLNNEINILHNSESRGIKFDKEDYIILEKLLGIDIGICFQHYIVNNLKSPQYKILEPLIDILSKCEGSNSCCAFIRLIGWDLLMAKNKSYATYNEENLIKMYVEILTDKIGAFQERYVQAVNTYIQEYRKRYSYFTFKNIIEEKRSKYIKLTQQLEWKVPIYKDIEEKEIKSHAKQLSNIKNEEERVKVIERYITDMGTRLPLSDETMFWRGKSWYKPFENEGIEGQIQKRIAFKRREKYCE